ncbi:MAG: hypothetical protein ACLFUJ_08920 [Phycisphaerae bacterium]
MKALHGLLIGCLLIASGGCFKFEADVKAPKEIKLGNWTAEPAEAADQGVIFTAYDSLALRGKGVTLAARLIDHKTGRSLPGIEIGFYEGSKKLGQAATDSRGIAQLPWTAPRVGSLRLQAQVEQVPPSVSQNLLNVRPVAIRIESVDPDRPIALVDVADTLVKGSSKDVIRGERPVGGAAGTISGLARQHSIVYIADRNELLTETGKNWFAGNGFPAGLILQADHKFEFADVRRLKTADPHNIKQTFNNVVVAITGRNRVAEDFLQEDLRTFLIVYVDADADDLREAADNLQKITGARKLNAVDNWRDLQVGLERDRDFPASQLARQFQQRAQTLQEEDD